MVRGQANLLAVGGSKTQKQCRHQGPRFQKGGRGLLYFLVAAIERLTPIVRGKRGVYGAAEGQHGKKPAPQT